RRPVSEEAVVALFRDEPVQGTVDRLGVFAFLMGISGTEKRQDRKRGESAVGGLAGVVSSDPLLVDLDLAGAVGVGVPVTVGVLMRRQPLQAEFHRLFGTFRTAVPACDVAPTVKPTKLINFGNACTPASERCRIGAAQ